jgi:hypothetical protein
MMNKTEICAVCGAICFGRNIAGIRCAAGWSRHQLLKVCGKNMDRRERQHFYAHLKNAEDRCQKRSVLVGPFSRIFGIPIGALLHDDLSNCTLEELQARFGFDVAEVEKRAADFRY